MQRRINYNSIALALLGFLFIAVIYVKHKLMFGIPLYSLFMPIFIIMILMSSQRAVIINRKVILPILILFGILLVSTFFSEYRLLALKQVVKYLCFAIFTLYSYILFRIKRNRDIFLNGYLFLFTLLSILGLYEVLYPDSYIFSFFRTQRSLTISPRIASVLQWSNQYGVLAALAIFLASKTHFKYILGLLFTAQAVFSGSRNALLAIACVLIILVMNKKYMLIAVVIITSIVFSNLKSLSVKRNISTLSKEVKPRDVRSSIYGKLFNGVSVDAHSTLDLRLRLWKAGVRSISNMKIFFGVGPDNFRKTVVSRYLPDQADRDLNAHNLFINILVEWGLAGLVVFSFILYRLVLGNISSDFNILIGLFCVNQIFDCFNYDVFYMVSMLTLLALFYTQKVEGTCE